MADWQSDLGPLPKPNHRASSANEARRLARSWPVPGSLQRRVAAPLTGHYKSRKRYPCRFERRFDSRHQTADLADPSRQIVGSVNDQIMRRSGRPTTMGIIGVLDSPPKSNTRSHNSTKVKRHWNRRNAQLRIDAKLQSSDFLLSLCIMIFLEINKNGV